MNYSYSYILRKIHVMSTLEKLFYFVLIAFGVDLTLLFGFWWFNPKHITHNFTGFFHGADYVLFFLLSYVVWYQIVNELFFWFVSYNMKKPNGIHLPKKGSRVAFLTAFVPGSEPYDILEKTLQAMVNTDYPHETWLLDEGDDPKAKKICKRLGVKHYSRKGISRYNLTSGPYLVKTKGGNYNSWYDQHAHKYDFVAQIDVDFLPRKDFLTKTLGYFKDPSVAFVGSPQIYGNTKESWITKGAAQQAYNFYGSMQKGFFGSDMQLFIGANHVVRVAAHNDIGGYSAHIVEDHLTGMKFYAKKWKSVYIPEILAIGEGPSTWDAYFSQQMRWAYGLIHILFTKSPRLFFKMQLQHVISYYLLQQYYFYGLAQVIGIILLSLYFIFGIQSTTMALIPLLILYIPLLLWQQIMFLWLQRFNIDPKNESGLMVHAKVLNLAAWPIYFLAFIGVLRGKRLTYKVTPKGKEQKVGTSLSLFLPHFSLGTITAIDIVFAVIQHNYAPLMFFWALFNTIAMYSFILIVLWEKLVSNMKLTYRNWNLYRFSKVMTKFSF